MEHAFGPRASPLTAAAILVERLVLAALACVLVGHHVADFIVAAIAGWPATARLTSEEVAGVLAVVLLGVLWLRARMGTTCPRAWSRAACGLASAFLAGVVAWGAITVVRHPSRSTRSAVRRAALGRVGWWPADAAMTALVGPGDAVPLLGGGDALARSAHEFQPPRIQALRRTGTSSRSLRLPSPRRWRFCIRAARSAERTAALVRYAPRRPRPAPRRPPWARGIAGILLAVTAVLLLLPAAHAALADAEQLLRRLASTHGLAERLALQHPRFGTYAYAPDLAAAATVLIILASGGRVPWLAHAYASASG